MMRLKRYEILDALPVYGPMYIPVSDDGMPFYSEGFPVRFFKSDNIQWVANFRPGWTNLKTVIELRDTWNLLIVAGGICYIMDPDQPKPIDVFGVSYETSFIVPDGRFILQDQTDFTIINSDGSYWYTERISWDGLKEVELNDNTIKGLACNPTHDADEWIPFSFNIDTKELIGGSYPRPEQIKKSRWRFW